VTSEPCKGVRTDAGVLAFFAAPDPQHIHPAVQTMGKLRRGLDNIRGRGDLFDIRFAPTMTMVP
jgi:hypothetical protein